MPFYVPIIVALVSIVVTALVTTYVRKTMIEKKVGNAEEKAREIIDDALKVAERSKREALLEAKEESLKTKNELEKETKERLDILNHSNDGFKIANEDLKLRGPGDLFGIRQSGLMNFRLGDIYQDAKVLRKANEAADILVRENSSWLKKIPDYESTASVII